MEWPILPSFLSKYVPHKEEYTPNKHGLFESDTLRGFLVDSSDDKSIQNPLSLFQVVPDKYPYETESEDRIESLDPPKNSFLSSILSIDRKIIRIDPRNLYPNMSCCDVFRKYLKDHNICNLCFEQDSQILLLYHKYLLNINYETEFEKFRDCLIELCQQYNNTIENDGQEYFLKVHSDLERKRLFIGYKCKYSNLYEYFFPVIYAGRVVAVLMQGQRIPPQTSQDEIFPYYRNFSESLKNSIEAISKSKYNQETMSEERENAIFRRISVLERRIEQEVIGFARMLVSNKFNEIQYAFRKELKNNTNSEGKIALEEYSAILDRALERICHFFNPNGFIRIYTAESSIETINKTNTKFYLIGTSEVLKKQLIPKEIKFLGITQDELDLRDGMDLAQFVYPSIQLKKGDIFRIEPLQVGGIRNLIWKNYNEESFIHECQFKLYGESLCSMYHMFLEPYHVLKSIEMQERLEVSMRVSVHEAANIIPTIHTTLSKEYSINNSTYNRIKEGATVSDIRSRERILYDSIQRLLLLDSLYRKSTLIFKNSLPVYSWTDLHRAVYSIETLFSESALKNKRQRIIVDINSYLSKCDFWTDLSAFNHILFNLVDNAVKYSLRGSKIYVTVDIPQDQVRYLASSPDKIDTLIISVINYGFNIPSSDRNKMFNLYYRSEQSKSEEGRGIGLFLVDKLCSALSYTIENANSVLVSKIHLPAKHYYTASNPGFKTNERLTDDIKRLLSDSVSPEIMERVVNVQQAVKWKIGTNEILSLLPQGTYENKFVLTLKAPQGQQLLRYI